MGSILIIAIRYLLNEIATALGAYAMIIDLDIPLGNIMQW